MWTQTINHIVGCKSLHNSLTGNGNLCQSLAHHPTAGDTTAASGCAIILLGDVLGAHNLTGDGNLLDWVRDMGFHDLLDRMKD